MFQADSKIIFSLCETKVVPFPQLHQFQQLGSILGTEVFQEFHPMLRGRWKPATDRYYVPTARAILPDDKPRLLLNHLRGSDYKSRRTFKTSLWFRTSRESDDLDVHDMFR